MSSVGESESVKERIIEAVFKSWWPEFLSVSFNILTTAEEPSVEDIATGYELFHAVVFCPPRMVFRTYQMINQLLSVKSTRTIIHNIINLFQSEAVTDEMTLISYVD